MISNIYKLKDSIVWVLILAERESTSLELFTDYSVVFTVPELRAFPQSGPLSIRGPQNATIILPKNVLPPEILTTVDSKVNIGTYREILEEKLVTSRLTSTDLIDGIAEAVIKAAEYDIKATPETVLVAPLPQKRK